MGRKKVPTVEIKEIFNLGSMESIRIIPDPHVKNGYKEIHGDNVFISPMNYKDIKDFEAKAIITCLEILKTA